MAQKVIFNTWIPDGIYYAKQQEEPMIEKTEWAGETCLCSEDMERDCVKALSHPGMRIVVVPTMKDGSFIVANVPLEEIAGLMKQALEQGDRP